MPDRTNVVPSAPTVTEEEWSTHVIVGMARAQRRLGGQKALAYTMDRTAKQLGNIMASSSGAFASAKPLFDAHRVEGTILDDVADLYGLRIVPKDAVCAHDDAPLSKLVVCLLGKAIDAEMDGIVTHDELLDMEHELRAVSHAVEVRLQRIKDHRAPVAVRA